MNENLKTRLLSLAWRGGAAAIVAFLAVALDYIPKLGLSEIVTAVLVLAGTGFHVYAGIRRG